MKVVTRKRLQAWSINECILYYSALFRSLTSPCSGSFLWLIFRERFMDLSYSQMTHFFTCFPGFNTWDYFFFTIYGFKSRLMACIVSNNSNLRKNTFWQVFPSKNTLSQVSHQNNTFMQLSALKKYSAVSTPKKHITWVVRENTSSWVIPCENTKSYLLRPKNMAGHRSKTKLYLPQYRILTSINLNRIKHETTTYSMQSVLSGVSASVI